MGLHRILPAASIVLVATACGPDVSKVERSATCTATAADVYPHLVDLKGFYEWSPWSQLDPDSKVTFSDKTDVVGATYEWKGNDEVGHGKMTIMELVPNEKVVHKLEFFEPWEGVSESSLHMKTAGESVTVTWKYSQDNDFMGKVMTTFMDMDEMLGPDYEKGLKQLESTVAASVKAREEAEKKAAAEKKAREEAQAAAEADGGEAAATP
jgi:hypothetical protein